MLCSANAKKGSAYCVPVVGAGKTGKSRRTFLGILKI